MKALVYLFVTQIKNRILSLRKKPGLMVLYGFVALIVIGSIIITIVSGNQQITIENVDYRVLFIFLSGFGLLYLYTFTYSGLSTGSSFFTMADVGLLFVAPISPKKVLIYGLINAIGKTVFASIFIFYQIPNLKKMFGFGFTELFALFFIYVAMIMFCQILSIGVYIFSNGNQKRKTIVKTILYIIISVLIIAVYLIVNKENVGVFDAIKLMLDSKWFGFMPVLGWTVMFFKGVIAGSMIEIIVSLVLYLGIGFILVSLLTTNDADYYEDVLHSTEVTYQRLLDYKEGRAVSSNTNRKIKVKNEEKGLLKGKGATVIVYKHLLEMKRSSRFIFIDLQTIIIAIGVAIAGYSIQIEGGYYIILAIVIYLQYFVNVFGRIKLELIKPYIYLVPDSSFKKILAASASSIIKPCIDSIFIFSALALVGGAGILDCIFMAIAYSCSGAMFVSLTVVYQRVLGGQPSRVAQVILGLFIMVVVIAPAVVASVLFKILLLPEYLGFLATLPYSIICLIFALIMFISCSNILDNAEYTGKL